MGSTMQHDERGCTADATVAVAGPCAAARMQRELSYGCSSGSGNGRAMSSSTDAKGVVVRMQQCSLRGSVDLG